VAILKDYRKLSWVWPRSLNSIFPWQGINAVVLRVICTFFAAQMLRMMFLLSAAGAKDGGSGRQPFAAG